MALTDTNILEQGAKAGLGEFMGFDKAELGQELRRFAHAIESAAVAPLLERIAALEAQVEQAAQPVADGGPALELANLILSMDMVTEKGLRVRALAREVLTRCDESPSEMALRSLACWLGVGGYNAIRVDAAVFERKIREAVDENYTAPPKAVHLTEAQQEPKLDKPARVGNGTFGVGVSSRLVVEAAQRHHEYHIEQQAMTPEQQAEQDRRDAAFKDLIDHGITPATVEKGGE